MAKQSVNIVERHAEKAVLGICGAALLAVIVMFGVSTPNKIELDSELVGPVNADQHVLDAAHKLRDKLRRANVDEVEVADPVPQLIAASSPIEYANLNSELPASVPMLPRVPASIGSGPVVGELTLAEVIATAKPRCTHDRATLDLVSPVVVDTGSGRGRGGDETATGVAMFPTAVNWVTVAARFDQERQMDVYKGAGYPVTRRRPYVLGVDLQRREKLSDGSYVEWVKVKPYMPLVLGAPPKVEIVNGPRGPAPSESSWGQVRRYRTALRVMQADVLRPMFPEKVYGEGWLYPKFKDVDLPALDRELCSAEDTMGCMPRPYPTQWDVETEQDAAVLDERKVIKQKLGEAKAALNARDWDEAKQIADSILKREGVRKNEEAQARGIIEDAQQGERDEDRGRLNPKKKVDEDSDDPAITRLSRYQVVWAHDAADPRRGGAESGKTYQYRLRLRLFNRLCARPSDVENVDDAKVVIVAGEWSEPSEDVSIPPDTRFFLTSGNPESRSGAKVTVFKWVEGVWVSGRLAVKIGERITGNPRKAVRVLPDGTVDRPRVDFDTGATVVDVDYDYMHRPKKRRGRSGITVGPAARTVALVYRDRDGDLHHRILAADKAASEYKSFKERVFDPKARERE